MIGYIMTRLLSVLLHLLVIDVLCLARVGDEPDERKDADGGSESYTNGSGTRRLNPGDLLLLMESHRL